MATANKFNQSLRIAQFLFALVCLALIPGFIHAQDPGNNEDQSSTAISDKKTLTVEPLSITITVTARKEPEPALSIPLSVTAVTESTLKDANIQAVKQAAVYAPNTFINEFTARAVSNPFFRGIGGSPTNPGVSTFIDGVPQLNSSSSNIEMVDVGQIEFVRGPEGALYGRNTAGGLINITSRPSSEHMDCTGRRELSAIIATATCAPRFPARFSRIVSA